MNSKPRLEIPELKVSRPGISVSVAGVFSDGIKKVSSQVEPYTNYWNESNSDFMKRLEQEINESAVFGSKVDRDLLLVIGDSSALGIGASAPQHGYVDLVRDFISKARGVECDAVVLARSGACLLYTSPSPRDRQKSRMPSSA